MDFDELSNKVIGCAIEVHKELGPGLLESSYEACLSHELNLTHIAHATQVGLPIDYKGLKLDCGYRIDVLVGDKLVIELKSVKALEPIHEAQLLTYLKLSGIKTGLLVNFNVTKLKDGIKRFVV